MAPYNLSDLAVKELKIPKKELAPAAPVSFTGKFLGALFVDFVNIVVATIFTGTMFTAFLKPLMQTRGLKLGWDALDLFPVHAFALFTITFGYFFFSFYFNEGQTYGMSYTKCRISMGRHSFGKSFRCALAMMGIYLSLGLLYKKITSMMAPYGQIVTHDHLWQELLVQKEMSAPALMELVKEEKAPELAEAA